MIGRLKQYKAKEVGLALLFLAPSLAVFVAFYFKPLVDLVDWGFYKSERGGASYRYVGFDNYREVLTGDRFLDGLWHSVMLVVFTIPAGVTIGILFALAANRKLRGIKVFQTVFSSTIASSVAITATIFYFLFNSTIGIFEVDWLQDQDKALPTVGLSLIWQCIGLSFVIVLAGLQAIPEEVLEASRLDGYGPVRRLFRIILPLLSPVLMFLSVVLVIFALQAFAQVEVLTGGGPGGVTRTLVWNVFDQNDPAAVTVGAVMSVGLFVLTALVSVGQFTLLERRVHYGR